LFCIKPFDEEINFYLYKEIKLLTLKEGSIDVKEVEIIFQLSTCTGIPVTELKKMSFIDKTYLYEKLNNYKKRMKKL